MGLTQSVTWYYLNSEIMRYYVSRILCYSTFYMVIPEISRVSFMNFYLSRVNTGAVTQLPHANGSLTYTH